MCARFWRFWRFWRVWRGLAAIACDFFFFFFETINIERCFYCYFWSRPPRSKPRCRSTTYLMGLILRPLESIKLVYGYGYFGGAAVVFYVLYTESKGLLCNMRERTHLSSICTYMKSDDNTTNLYTQYTIKTEFYT